MHQVAAEDAKHRSFRSKGAKTTAQQRTLLPCSTLAANFVKQMFPFWGCKNSQVQPPISFGRGQTMASTPRVRRQRRGNARRTTWAVALPESLQYCLQWKMTVSAKLRSFPQNFHSNCAETCQNPGSQNSLACAVSLGPTSGGRRYKMGRAPNLCGKAMSVLEMFVL